VKYKAPDSATLWFKSQYGSYWRLHEYVLLAYSDWLELNGDIEALMAEAVEKHKQEELRWEEIRDRKWYQQSVSPQAETGLSKAFTLFNLDSSATQDDVKKRYRALSKLYHPDTQGSEEEFKRLNQANQVLMQHFA
jgi:DnaJ-domain-containing protein 1